jgi:Copper binding proteins, plastocyanin/azurin family
VLALLAGLSAGHKIGLAVVAAVFIGFALAASFLAPRRWPDFPGRNALSVFVIASFVLFFGMLAAVYMFGKEPAESASAAEPAQGGKPASRTIKVTETEFKIQLPPLKELGQGRYTFDVHNAGKIPHDLVVTGGDVSREGTKTIPAGGDAKLTVALGPGSYTLYCSVPGHRQLGMQATLSVG